jgi:hypothetical protein
MTARLFLTTDLRTQRPHFLNTMANVSLAPVRYFFGGKTVAILNGAIQPVDQPSQPSWIRTMWMIAIFIPGLIIGVLARYFSYNIQEVRAGFALIIKGPQPVEPPVVDFNAAVISTISNDLAFFRELIKIPNSEFKTWYENKRSQPEYQYPFYGAADIAAWTESYHTISPHLIDLLVGIYEQASEKVREVGYQDEMREPIDSYKGPLCLSDSVLKQLRFDAISLNSSRSSLPPQTETPQNEVSKNIAFFLDLLEVADNDLAGWLAEKKLNPDYQYPFYAGAKITEKRPELEKEFSKEIIDTLEALYLRSWAKVLKTGLESYLDEKRTA